MSAIFFDIDGTLIDVKLDIRSITDETKKSLDELKENGHGVFLATGRCKCFIGGWKQCSKQEMQGRKPSAS